MRPVPAKAIMVGVAILAVAAAVVLLRPAREPRSRPRVYCGPDGQLTGTRPIQSHRSYCIRALTDLDGIEAKRPVELSFEILTDEGEILRDFAVMHEKQMHLILVRKDLSNFQHVHPRLDPATGRWTLPGLVIPVEGEYRLFADFTPEGGMRGPDGMALPVTPAADFRVGAADRYRPAPLDPPVSRVETDGYDVALVVPESLRAGEEARLVFSVSRDGENVTTLEPYLGALGHAVVLKEGDLQFLHAHALEENTRKNEGVVAFAVHLPEPGRYKSFVQFQHLGRVLTASFVLPPVSALPPDDRAAPSSPQAGHGGGH